MKTAKGAVKTAIGAVLSLPAELNIKNNGKLYEKLETAAGKGYSKIIIDLGKVKNIDLSSIQMLLSFYKECLMDDMQVDFKGPLHAELKNKLQGCGFLDSDGYEEVLFPFLGKKGANIGNN
jgi:anti-anti-sigma regulatory factor